MKAGHTNPVTQSHGRQIWDKLADLEFSNPGLTGSASLANLPSLGQPHSDADSMRSAAQILVKANVGFGNALYVRGHGAGLSWKKGTPLVCISDDTWGIVLSGVRKPFVFKLLLNDLKWSTGEDYFGGPGDQITVTPLF